MGTPLLILGAGPVGLLGANLAAAAGFSVTILEARNGPRLTPRALGVAPPSLSVLRTLTSSSGRLDERLVAAGITITEARVWGTRRYLGSLDLTQLPEPHPFILSVSQVLTEEILRSALADHTGQVELRYGARVVDIREDGDLITARMEDGSTAAASFALGCDGPTGISRGLTGVAPPKALGRRFAMLDLPDDTGWENRAHLYFTRSGSLESFPFGAERAPKMRRRWIAEIKGAEWDQPNDSWIPAAVAEAVSERAGLQLETGQALWSSRFEPRQTIAKRYAIGRLFLCGDAAHEFSPIGGQGMNTGFGDAAAAVHLLRRVVRGHLTTAAAGRVYQSARRPAAKAAARRARVSMWIGTRSGLITAPLRDTLVSWLLGGPLRSRLPAHFAMLTLPGSAAPDLPQFQPSQT